MFMKQVDMLSFVRGAERVLEVRAETELTFESNGRTSAPSQCLLPTIASWPTGITAKRRPGSCQSCHGIRREQVCALTHSLVGSREDGRLGD